MFRLLLSRQGPVVVKQVHRLYYDNNNCLHFYILKRFTKNSIQILKRLTIKYKKILRIYNMLKLLKMLKQIISQLEQMCLKLGLENGYTLTVSNFKRQFIPQKWNKGAITKGLRISSWDLRRPWSQERRWWEIWSVAAKGPVVEKNRFIDCIMIIIIVYISIF